MAPFFAAFMGVSLSFEVAVDELGLELVHTFVQDPRAGDSPDVDARWAQWAPPEVEEDLECFYYEALAGRQPIEQKRRALSGIECSPLPFHFPSQRMCLLGVERDAGSGCVSQAERATSFQGSFEGDGFPCIAGSCLHVFPHPLSLSVVMRPADGRRQQNLWARQFGNLVQPSGTAQAFSRSRPCISSPSTVWLCLCPPMRSLVALCNHQPVPLLRYVADL